MRLLEAASKATEKTISFFNAYCTGLDISFLPGQGGGSSSRVGSSQVQLQISPQRIAIGAVVHDNNWPLESHGAGESFGKQRTPQQVSRPTLMFVPAGAIILAISTPMVASGPSAAAIESQASTCPESVRTALQRAVDMNCKKAKSSCKGNDSCSILAVKWEAQRACAMARWKIMVKCYKGGDTRRKEEVNNRFRGMAHCEELILKKCRPKPEPTPQPAPNRLRSHHPNNSMIPTLYGKRSR